MSYRVGYKVVWLREGNYVSATVGHPDLRTDLCHGRRKLYELNEWVSRDKNCGGLAVFLDLEEARDFAEAFTSSIYKMVVFKVHWRPSRLWGLFTPLGRNSHFYKIAGKEKNSSIYYSTVFAASVKLIKEIEDALRS